MSNLVECTELKSDLTETPVFSLFCFFFRYMCVEKKPKKKSVTGTGMLRVILYFKWSFAKLIHLFLRKFVFNRLFLQGFNGARFWNDVLGMHTRVIFGWWNLGDFFLSLLSYSYFPVFPDL